MIPRLYETYISDFKTEGLGSFRDLLSVSITRNRNQIPTLTMTYPINGPLSKELQEGMVIVADMGLKDDERNQQFRIVDISTSTTGMTITANHIWADLSNMPLKKNISEAHARPSRAFELISDALAWSISDLGFASDIPTVANLGWNFKELSNANAAIFGADTAGDQTNNTMEALYNGEFRFNNYYLTMLQHAGEDNGIVIKYGRNMQSITRDETTSDTYNAIMPYVTYSPEEMPQPDGEPFDGQATVQYLANGKINLFSTPYKGHTPVGTIKNGEYLKFVAKTNKKTINDDTWYKTDTGGWVDEHLVTFDKSGNYIVNKINAQGTLEASDDITGIIVKNDGVGTIAYAGPGQVPLYTSPFGGRKSGQYLSNGASYKIYWKAKDINGIVWYNLGNRDTQWVSSQYFVLSKTGDYATAKAYGRLSINGNVTVMSGPGGTGSTVNWNNKGQYPIYDVSTDSAGSKWYHIGQSNGHQLWVKAGDSVSFKEPGTVEYKEEDAEKANVQQTAQVPVYHDPNGLTPTGKYYSLGSLLRITAQSSSQGKTYYEVGANQWINADFFSFAQAVDVAPGENDSDAEPEVSEETLELDSTVLISKFARVTNAPLRVQAVDLSSYGIGNDKAKLLAVAQAYMKEYRIGYPNISLTVSYEQMQGEYQKLTNVDLYDYVSILFDEVGIFEKAQCNSVTWDPVREVATSITIGQIPITYDHALNNFVTNMVAKNTTQATKRATHLFGEMKQIMNEKDQDQRAGLLKLTEQLGMDRQAWRDSYDRLQSMVTSINTTVQDVHNWIAGGGGGEITAYPNWQKPTELRALSNGGGYLRFNAEGLEYVGRDGVARSAIDSQGRLIAERITGGTITGVKLEGITVDGDSYIRSIGGDGKVTVMSGDHGFAYTGPGKEKIALDWDNNWGTLRLGDQYLYASDIAWIRRQRGGRIH